MENQDVWAFEQYGVPLPFKEWVFIDPVLRPPMTNRNAVYKAIMGTWRNCQQLLPPIQSPHFFYVSSWI